MQPLWPERPPHYRLHVLLAVVILFPRQTCCQFPRACTSGNTTCCPSAPSSKAGTLAAAPCGGPERGVCADAAATGRWVADPVWFPFSRVCNCTPHFFGAACEMCRPGWTGPNCATQQLRVRRDFFREMEERERQAHLRTMDAMKRGTLLGYATPDGRPLSDFDALVVMHARSIVNASAGCLEACSWGHNGPGFLTWHRHLLRLFEAVYVRHGGADGVEGLPYFDWSDASTRARALSPPYFGGDGDAAQQYQITTGAFANWTTVNGSGHATDLRIRREIAPPAAWIALPSSRNLSQLVQSTPQYDVFPWRRPCSRGSVTNRLEGFMRYDSSTDSCQHRHNHNLVHILIGGAHGDMGQLLRSANDPLFYMLHTWVDRYFEEWLQAHHPPSFAGYKPMVGGPPGHSGVDCAAPIFPCHAQAEGFAPAAELGYEYAALGNH